MARSTFQIRFEAKNAKMYTHTPHFRNTWKLQCPKSARCCGAKHISMSKCTHTSRSEHFWRLRCRTSARRCGAKHISNSKCTKHLSVEALLEVDMSKRISKSKCAKHTILGALLEVEMSKKYEKVHAQKCKKLTGTEHFWAFRCRFAWQARAKLQNVKVL